MLIRLIIGALARLVMPGKQSIGVIMTTMLGAADSLIGTWLSHKLGQQRKRRLQDHSVPGRHHRRRHTDRQLPRLTGRRRSVR